MRRSRINRSRNKRQTSKRSRRPRTTQKRSCWLNKRKRRRPKRRPRWACHQAIGPSSSCSSEATWTSLSSMPRIGHSQLWTFEAPFIVRGAALRQELKPHQSLMNVWISGFDRNETVCSKGRAAMHLPNAAILRKAMLKYAPDGVQELEPGNDAYNKILKDCKISGMAAVSRNSGSEPYSAGTLRYTLHGSSYRRSTDAVLRVSRLCPPHRRVPGAREGPTRA